MRERISEPADPYEEEGLPGTDNVLPGKQIAGDTQDFMVVPGDEPEAVNDWGTTALEESLGEPLGNVSYHVKTLLEFDCVELVKTEPRRGAVEHFYRATERAFFSDSDWESIPASARKGISGAMLAGIGQDATAALGAGTLDSRDESHLSHTPLLVDEKGWQDIAELLEDTLNKALEIQTESANRLAEEKGEGIDAKLAVLYFERGEKAKPKEKDARKEKKEQNPEKQKEGPWRRQTNQKARRTPTTTHSQTKESEKRKKHETTLPESKETLRGDGAKVQAAKEPTKC